MYECDSIDLYVTADATKQTTESRILQASSKILNSTVQFECPEQTFPRK